MIDVVAVVAMHCLPIQEIDAKILAKASSSQSNHVTGHAPFNTLVSHDLSTVPSEQRSSGEVRITCLSYDCVECQVI